MKEGHPVHRRVGSSRAPASQNPVHTRGGYQCVPILEPRVPSSWACLGTSCWEPLGTCSWEPLGNLFLGTLLGNQPCLGTWEPNSQPCAVRIWLLRGILLEKETLPGNPVPNLARRADLAAPTCSGTFTMAEDPKLTLLGKNVLKSCDSQELKTFAHGFPVLGTAGSQAPILHVPSSRN